jgi:hypothetical protein
MRGWFPAALVLAGSIWSVPAVAMEITQSGLTFSDDGGGFTLKGVTGSGSLDDPYVVVEEVTGPREAVLTISGLKGVGNRIGSHHIAGIAMTKIVVNRSEDTWQNYQLELREVPTRHSPYEDGLSFAQNTVIAGAFTASSFPSMQRLDEPQDTLGFSGKSVSPGESAEFSFLITDMSPIGKFYLYQQPLQPVSDAMPEPRAVQQGAVPFPSTPSAPSH